MLTLTRAHKAQHITNSVEELATLPCVQTYEPVGTRYKPIEHHALAGMVRDSILEYGYGIGTERYVVSKGGAAVQGVLDLVVPNDTDMNERALAVRAEYAGMTHSGTHRFLNTTDKLDVRLKAVFRHSLDGIWALRLSCAAEVMVCTNGMFIPIDAQIGEVRRRHTSGADYVEVIQQAISRFAPHANQMMVFRDRLSEMDISNPEGDALIIRAGRENILPWENCRTAAEQWHEPNHPEFKDRNGWSLYNAFTEAVKTRSAVGQTDTFDRLHELFVVQN